MSKKDDINFAFHQTIPVLPGFIFLGIAFGLMLQNAGYHFLWAFIISVCVYAGSMQFVLVTLLTGGAGILYTAMITLFINGRHIFYGSSLIERYRHMGKRYPYLVFALTDETYSVICRTRIPDNRNEKDVLFFISLLNQCYWVIGSVLGGLIGQFLTFDSTGIDFSMTALFTAIVIEQWEEDKNRLPIIIGFLFSIIFLLLLGPDRFILPSLATAVILLLGIRRVRRKQIKIDCWEK